MQAFLKGMAAILVAVIIGNAPQATAGALTIEQLRAQCLENLKQEFGAAKVRIQTIRRSQIMDMAFGRLEMTDGSTREIRCRVYRGRRLDVSFRTNGSGADAWTGERPSNAGYIETEEEKAAREEKEAGEANETDQQAAASPEEGDDGAKDATEKDDAEAKTEDSEAAEEEEDTRKPRFIKVETN